MTLLRVNVGFPTEESVQEGIADTLENDLDTAAAELYDMGIELDDTRAADINLQVMYAAWLYNKRKTGEGMGQSLITRIHNRQVTRATERSY
jgi:hypothetical protein